MLRKIVAALLLSAPIAADASTAGGATVLHFKRVVVGDGSVVDNAFVLIDGDRVRAIGADDTRFPADAKRVALSDYVAIPGLIDAHTHVTFYWDPRAGGSPVEQLLTRQPAKTLLLATTVLPKLLRNGVTTARDLGSVGHADLFLRELISAGRIEGPRLYVAGFGLIRKGDVPDWPAEAEGPADVRRKALQQIKAGADWVKMFASTGSAEDLSGKQVFSFAEIKAAADAAHESGKRLAVHSYGPEAAHDAVRAGADSIEHAVDLSDETLKEMARKGVFYVPTIDHNRYYIDSSAEFGYGAATVKEFEAFIERNLKTLRRAHALGVRIVMGSDAAFTMYGQNTRELAWFVRAGMTPAEALATATTNGAAMLGEEDELGRIAPGYYADIVAVAGDPLADVSVVIDGIKWVMKGGKIAVDARR